MGENRTVGMAGYQDFMVRIGIGAEILFYFFHQLHGASGSGWGFKAHQFQGTPYIPDKEPSQRPQFVVQQASLMAMDEE